MSCKEYRECDVYLAAEDAEAGRRAETHLAECMNCRQWKREYDQMMALYLSTATEEPRMNTVVSRRRSGFPIPLLAAAAMMLFAVGIGVHFHEKRVATQRERAASRVVPSWEGASRDAPMQFQDFMEERQDEFDRRVDSLRGAIARLKVEISPGTF